MDNLIFGTAESAVENFMLQKGMKKHKIREVIERLQEYKVGFFPEKNYDHFEPGDEKTPFFSEAYLYNLMGKEEARVLLALMRPLFEIEKPLWKEKSLWKEKCYALDISLN